MRGTRPLPLSDYEPQPGDVLAFSGRGPVAWLIHLATLSRYAHVAVVAEHEGQCALFESTSLSDSPCIVQGKRVSGPQVHLVRERIRTAGCRVWLARPFWPLIEWESRMLSQWLLAQMGKGYDFRDAAKSASKIMKRLKAGDESATMCSELCIRAFQTIRRVPPGPQCRGPIDPSDYSPRGAMHALCDRWQVLQPPRAIAC